MNLKQLKDIIDSRVQIAREDKNWQVVISVKLPYSTVGSIPTVPVKTVNFGFDWEDGKFIIYPEEDLTPSDRDFAKQMKDMQDRAGLADYENRNLKAEIRRLQKKIKSGSGGNYSDIISDGGMDPR